MQKLALMKYSSNDNKICHALIWRGYGLAYKQPNDWWFGMSVFMVGPHLNQICTAIHQNRLPKFTISGIRMLLSWEWAWGSKFNSNRKTLRFVFPIFFWEIHHKSTFFCCSAIALSVMSLNREPYRSISSSLMRMSSFLSTLSKKSNAKSWTLSARFSKDFVFSVVVSARWSSFAWT